MKVQTTAGQDKRMSRIAITLAGALALAACTGDSPLTPSQKLQTSSIRLATGALAFSALGDSAQIQVYGEGISASSVSWSVTDPNVAAVQSTGVVRAVSDGSTYVVARLGRWTDSAQVTVAPQPAKLVIVPQVDTLTSVGGTARLTVQFYDRNGNTVKNQQVSWASLNAPVVSVDQNGRITAVQPGVAQVTAMTSLLADTADVLVLQDVNKISLTPTSSAMYVGQTVAFSAVALDSKGSVVSSVPITWTSSNPVVASVSNGMVTGISSGSATITASGGGKSATSSVNVKQVPVSAVVVSPSSASTTVGGATQFTAQTLDASGNTLTNRTISWTSSNTGVATVTASGLVTAVGAGQATITATSESVSGTAAFTAAAVVSAPPAPAPVAAVSLSPASVSLTVGGALQMSATTYDASGNVLTGRSITWTSSAPSVATVSGTGLVTAVAAGSATILATSEGVTGQAAASVTAQAQPAPVASVTVSPSSNSLQVSGAVQLSATTKDASGNVLTGRVITWSSSAPSVATVSSTGLVTAIAAGQATINAVSETVVGSASASVAAPVQATAASVTLAPTSSTLQIGGNTQLSATVKDANGNVLTGRTVTWSSVATTVASVTATGLVTALATGSTNVNASVDGVTGSAAIVVSAPPPTSPTGYSASSDFEDGTLGPYWYQYTQAPNDMQIVSDPTGQGHGKVVRLRYYRPDSTYSTDRNRSITWQTTGGLGYGQTVYFRGRVFVPQPAPGMEGQMRKLFYYHKNGSSPYGDFIVVGLYGNYLRFEGGSINGWVTKNMIAPMNFSQWYTLEIQITVNSSATTTDGVMRIWLNGSMIYENTAVPYMQHTGAYEYFSNVDIGDQTQADLYYDEYRYWDDVAFSSQRIGQ